MFEDILTKPDGQYISFGRGPVTFYGIYNRDDMVWFIFEPGCPLCFSAVKYKDIKTNIYEIDKETYFKEFKRSGRLQNSNYVDILPADKETLEKFKKDISEVYD